MAMSMDMPDMSKGTALGMTAQTATVGSPDSAGALYPGPLVFFGDFAAAFEASLFAATS